MGEERQVLCSCCYCCVTAVLAVVTHVVLARIQQYSVRSHPDNYNQSYRASAHNAKIENCVVQERSWFSWHVIVPCTANQVNFVDRATRVMPFYCCCWHPFPAYRQGRDGACFVSRSASFHNQNPNGVFRGVHTQPSWHHKSGTTTAAVDK